MPENGTGIGSGPYITSLCRPPCQVPCKFGGGYVFPFFGEIHEPSPQRVPAGIRTLASGLMIGRV